MKRILLVVHTLQMGGIERHTISIANALFSLGHEVHILVLKKRYELKPTEGVYVHFVDFDKINRLTIIGLLYDLITRIFLANLIPKSGFVWRGAYGGLYFRFFLNKLEKKHGHVDMVASHGQGAFERIWSWRNPRAYQVVVSPVLPPKPNSILERWYTYLLYADRKIIVNSRGVRDSLQQKLYTHGYKAKSINVISNPCPVDEIRQQADEPTKLPTTPYIVHVGRLTYQKDQAFLIRAFHKANITEKLVIVGSGQEERPLKRLADDLGLSDRIIFAGKQYNPFPWMKHAKLFVLSSRIEGFGLVLTESLACGTPVVAVDCPGGIRDVLIEEQAQFICARTEEALAAKIEEALSTPIEIKSAWVERFDSKHIANQYLNLLIQPDTVNK